MKEGQCSEEDIFGNLHEPGPFDDFLNILGRFTDEKPLLLNLSSLANSHRVRYWNWQLRV